MTNATAILKKGAGRTVKAGGMWIYDNEIAAVRGDFENGDLICVEDFDVFFMGYGYINTRSKITVRLMARQKEHRIDHAFL